MRTLLTLLLMGAVVACNRPARGIGAGATTAVPPGMTAQPETTVTDSTAYTGTLDETLTSGGVTREYRLHIPTNYQPGTPMPLVLNFHGLSSNARQEEALSGMSIKADAEGFIVVYPNGLGKKWNDGPGPANPDLQFVRDLIAELQARYSIDSERIYVTGISNGGGMANRVACEMSEEIAAMGPVSGAYNLWRKCEAARPVPVVAFHGTADNIVPYEGVGRGELAPPIRVWAAAWAERNGCGAAPAVTYQGQEVTGETWGNCQAEVVLYTIAGGGHYWPGAPGAEKLSTMEINATDIMWEFFKAHPKAPSN